MNFDALKVELLKVDHVKGAVLSDAGVLTVSYEAVKEYSKHGEITLMQQKVANLITQSDTVIVFTDLVPV